MLMNDNWRGLVMDGDPRNLEQGYVFVGANGTGNNAYFVRRDLSAGLRPLTLAEGFVDARFRDSRVADGSLTSGHPGSRLQAIKMLPVVDVRSQRMVTIATLYGL